MSRATELADALRNAVQTYPQMSEDEPGGYSRQEDQLMDDAAAELRRLDRVSAELVGALHTLHSVSYLYRGMGVSWADKHDDALIRARAALTSATKETT